MTKETVKAICDEALAEEDKAAEVMAGLAILRQYDEGLDVCAEHDIFCVSRIDVSKEDAEMLDKLGWFISDEYDSWAVFV